MKKVVSLVISLLLIIGIVPISASAETTSITQDGIEYLIDTETGEAEVFYADESIVTAEITSEINGYPVTSIGGNAFWNCTSLTSVTIPDSVTSIGLGSFWDCTSLASVTIPDSVTSIGDEAFSGCTSLTSVTIPDSVISIGFWAFRGCTSLTSVTIGDSVTSIDGFAFYNTAYYNDETNWENGVLYIGNYLIAAQKTHYDENYNDVVDLEVKAEYTIKDGTKIIADGAFYNCTSLTSVTIPDSVTSIGYGAFSGCTSLTSVTIPDSVTSIDGYTFSWCESLTSVTISGSVTSIGDWAFSGCTSLTSVTIPDSVTSIGDGAFSGCTSLTSVTIPDSVTSIGYEAFGYYYDDNWDIQKIENFTIYGYTGSAAETYANNNGFTFIDVENMPEPPTTQGDLNGDGKLNSLDVLAMKKYVVAEESVLSYPKADLNGDGNINSTDILYLKRLVANG